MKTLVATTLIATSAHGSLCTFENLPAPTQTDSYSSPYGFYYDPVNSYEGFNFTSSHQPGGYTWWYYDLVGEPGYGGYDEAIVGDRAIFTPFGSSSSYNFRVSRNELWRLYSLEITAVWSAMTVLIEGYRYGDGVFAYTAQLNVAQRVKLNISNPYPGPLNNITDLKICSVGANSSQLAIDNIEYAVVPAPAVLSLLGVVGLVRFRRR